MINQSIATVTLNTKTHFGLLSTSAEENIMLITMLIVVLAIIFMIAALIAEYKLNKIDGCIVANGVPEETRGTKVVTKRTFNLGRSMTEYYISFEFAADGSRKEYQVSGETFGLIAEGDKGTLSNQGEKFISFERIIENADKVEEGK